MKSNEKFDHVQNSLIQLLNDHGGQYGITYVPDTAAASADKSNITRSLNLYFNQTTYNVEITWLKGQF